MGILQVYTTGLTMELPKCKAPPIIISSRGTHSKQNSITLYITRPGSQLANDKPIVF